MPQSYITKRRYYNAINFQVFNQGGYSYRDPETMTPRACGRAPKHWKEQNKLGSSITPKASPTQPKPPTSPKVASPQLTLIPRDPLMRHKTLQVVSVIMWQLITIICVCTMCPLFNVFYDARLTKIKY